MTTFPHRQRGQIMGLAAVAMVAVVGMLAFVVDAGIFFMIRAELQNAADAGALAGARFLDTGPFPTCPALEPCQQPLPPGSKCSVYSAVSAVPARMACLYAMSNVAVAQHMCNSEVVFDTPPAPATTPSNYSPPGSPTIVVNIHCRAEYSFGRILNLTRRDIAAHATAALGLWDTAVTPPQIRTFLSGSTSAKTARLIRDLP